MKQNINIQGIMNFEINVYKLTKYYYIILHNWKNILIESSMLSQTSNTS